MRIEDLRNKVRIWDLSNDEGAAVATAKYSFILNQIEHYAARDWKVYLPSEYSEFNPNYLERLARWVGNLSSDVDQQLLLEYAAFISFFGHDDFSALYRTAFNGEILRWIAQQVGATFDPGGPDEFAQIVRYQADHKTWFCPVTDSMDINEFCKVNHLQGVGHRPAFAPLQTLAEEAGNPNVEIMENLKHYMARPNPEHATELERLVLLEDIVGSSTQCIKALRWAVQGLGKHVLFVPLILCPNGVQALRDEEKKWNGRLAVRPVVQLHRRDLLGPERQSHAGFPRAEAMEDLARRCSAGVLARLDPFGYKKTGCSIATFANTPDNTLPVVHHKPRNGGWEPLFPRVFRD